MNCPDELTLWKLVEGDADDASLETLDAHLDACAECRALVGVLTSGTRPTREASAPQEDRTLGRFKVGEVLGEGAMGRVFAGSDPSLERRVALKVLHDETNSAKGRARLLREAQAMARLNHPHVLTVYEVGTAHDRVFIAMERAVETLREALGRGLSRSQRVEAMLQAGEGLGAAHEAGVLHRDFKPENVLLFESGGAKVADFGLAGVAASSDDKGALDLTRTGALLGTPLYMAPERLRGEEGDARSDQFSYCVTFWEALSGTRPFHGGSLEELIEAIDAGPREAINAPEEAALRRGLSPDPNARFPSMRTLLGALRRRRRTWPRAAMAAALVLFAAGALWFLRPYDVASPERCSEREAPLAEPFNDWRDGQRADWRARWTRARQSICEMGDPPEGRACLIGMGEEFAGLAAEELISTHIDMFDPARCAGASFLREELQEARRLLRRGAAEEALQALDDKAESAERELLAANALRALARFDAAEERARAALFHAQEDEDRWRIAEGWLALVSVSGAAGEYDDAARTLLHAREAVLALGSAPLEERLDHLEGTVHTQLGDFSAAGDALRRALHGRAQRVGEDDPALAALHTSLGHLARLEGRLDDALMRHQTALRLNRTLREDHVRVARNLHNLGGVLRRQGRSAEALEHYDAANAIRRAHFGERHPEVALGLNSIGLVHYESERFEEARTFWLEARGIFQAHAHADVAMCEHNLALANLALAQPSRALAHGLAALHLDEVRLGPDSKRVGVELVTLTRALSRLGRRAEARTRATRAKEIAALLGDPELANEADAALLERAPRARRSPRRRARPEESVSAREAPSETGGLAGETSAMEGPRRPGGSGFYGGGQAWD